MIIDQEEVLRFGIGVTPGRCTIEDGSWFADQGDGGKTPIDDPLRPLQPVHATAADDLSGTEHVTNGRARAPPVRDCVPKLA